MNWLKTKEEPMFPFKSEGRKKPMSQLRGSQAGGILSNSRESQPYCPIRPSSNWRRPTHIRESILLYPLYHLNVNLIQNTLIEAPRIMFDHIT